MFDQLKFNQINTEDNFENNLENQKTEVIPSAKWNFILYK